MKCLWPVSALMLVAIATVTIAQEKPDFSGRWILVTPSNEGFARELTVSYGIEERMPALIVVRQYATNVERDTHRLSGGGGTVNSNPAIGSTRYSVIWDYDRLVILTSHDSGPTPESMSHTEYNETWSLDVRGRLIILATDRAPDSPPITTVLTYRKAG